MPVDAPHQNQVRVGDRAMDWLEPACQDRLAYMDYAKVDPPLESLRSDQRFILP
jgi:hypothetical protein